MAASRGWPSRSAATARRWNVKATLARPLQPGVRRRTAAAAVVGVVVLLLTRWPAAAAAAGVASAALPRLMSGAATAQQMARLEAIEQ